MWSSRRIGPVGPVGRSLSHTVALELSGLPYPFLVAHTCPRDRARTRRRRRRQEGRAPSERKRHPPRLKDNRRSAPTSTEQRRTDEPTTFGTNDAITARRTRRYRRLTVRRCLGGAP